MLAFGVPSIAGVFVARLFIMPRIPELIFESGEFRLTKGTFILTLFAVMVLGSAVSMIRRTNKNLSTSETRPPNPWISAIAGLIVGAGTGLIGAGGGFLIVPALIILLKLDVRKAIATSLFVICLLYTSPSPRDS